MNLDNHYLDILTDLYDDFSQHYFGDMPFEEWRCKVDVHYRETFGTFPQAGKNLRKTLKQAAADVGQKLIRNHEEEMESALHEERIEARTGDLVGHIEAFLRHKRRRNKLAFPFSQRFTRGDVWSIEREIFDEETCERCEGYDPAFDRLAEEGVFHLVERGSEPPHDVFQLVDV
jgi:hypothetical protein